MTSLTTGHDSAAGAAGKHRELATGVTEALVDANADVFSALAQHPWVRGLADGTLPAQAFAAWAFQCARFAEMERRALLTARSFLPPGDLALDRLLDRLTRDTEREPRELAGILPGAVGLAPTGTWQACLGYGSYVQATAHLGLLEGLAAIHAVEEYYRRTWESVLPDVQPGSPYLRWVENWTSREFRAVVDGIGAGLDRRRPAEPRGAGAPGSRVPASGAAGVRLLGHVPGAAGVAPRGGRVTAGTEAFGRARPLGAGDLRDPETAGIAPVPEDGRYGRPSRVFFPWFAGNLELSAVFLGTVAASLGLGFPLGAAAIMTGIVIGAVPVACLCTWGPLTGTAQVPLARMPFGRSVIAPGAIQWGSAVAWIAIGCYFGAQAARLLLGVPFLAAAGIVLALVGTIAAWGYEGVMTIEKWGSWVMAALFALLTARLLLGRHVALPAATAHGGALAGGAAVMVAIALSGSGSWASYASDYSRYLPRGTSRRQVFWWTVAGMVASYGWLALVGLAAASALGNQTAGGVAALMGGGAAGDVTLAAIAVAAILSSAINAYSGSLALQTLDVRVRRPVIAAASAAAAFLLVWWMQDGNVYQRITNLLLLTGYWLAPFCGVILIDWHRNRARYTPAALASALAWRALRPGWPALAAFAVGLAAMVPFVNTTLWAGPAARAMDGADLSYYVGFAVTTAAYAAICQLMPDARGRVRHIAAREAGAASRQ